MYDEAQDLRDFAESLEERFGCDTVNVSLWDEKVEYHLEWEDDDRDILEQLDDVRDIVENNLDPDHEPDNVDISLFEDRPSISVGYDLSDDSDDETNDETESETDEE